MAADSDLEMTPWRWLEFSVTTLVFVGLAGGGYYYGELQVALPATFFTCVCVAGLIFALIPIQRTYGPGLPLAPYVTTWTKEEWAAKSGNDSSES